MKKLSQKMKRLLKSIERQSSNPDCNLKGEVSNDEFFRARFEWSNYKESMNLNTVNALYRRGLIEKKGAGEFGLSETGNRRAKKIK